MGIPAQVLQQEEEAEKLMGNPDPEEQEAEESEEETEEAPEQQEESAPQEEVIEEEPKQDRAYWEQRFKVMEGKFKSEVPRLSDQIRDLMSQNDKLTNLIATMSPKEEKPETPKGTYLTDEESEKLEEEGFERSTVDLIGSMAERIVEKRLSKYDQKVDGIANDVAESSKDRFFSELDSKVPDWKVINEDSGFLEWLSESDGYSGSTKQQSLDTAYANMDAGRVAKIFNAYKTPTHVGKLEKQVAPGKGAASAATVSQKKVWSKGEITKFYSDQIKGKYSEKEAAKFEKDIFLAQKEGRITP